MSTKQGHMSRRRMLGLSAAASAGILSGAAGSAAADNSASPNLIFVFSDQQRNHALGYMNSDPVETPNIDAFADDSVVFTNALSASPLCGPYRGTLMTGRYPHSTGVIGNNDSLRSNEMTFAKALNGAGYDTAYIGKWHLMHSGYDHWSEWHFNQNGQFVPPQNRGGFKYWHGVNCNHRTFWRLYYEDSEEPVVCEPGWQPTHDIDTAIDYINGRNANDTPFALFVSMVPPHNTHGPGFKHHEVFPGQRKNPQLRRGQYHAPDEFEEPYKNRNLERRPNVPDDWGDFYLPGYFGACNSLDSEFGRLLDAIDRQGLTENTIVVYTSDHGDQMGSHGSSGKGIFYEESVNIPFVMRWPGHIEPGRDDILFNSVDVMPTILGLMGIEVPRLVEGGDYSGIFRGENIERPDSALLQLGSWRAIRTQTHTFAVNHGTRKGPEGANLFNNAEDPYQMHPIAWESGDREEMNDMRESLAEWLERTNDPFLYRIPGPLSD